MIISEEHTISATILTGYKELVQALGGDPVKLLASAGLDRGFLFVSPRRLLFSQFERLIHRTVAALKCADFGVRLAERHRTLELLPPLAGIIRNAPSLTTLFHCCAERTDLLSSAVHLTLVSHPNNDLTGWRYHFAGQYGPAASQISELFIRSTQCGIEFLTAGRVQPREIWFVHPPLGNEEQYFTRFGTTVCFNQEADIIFYESADMDQGAEGHDHALFEQELRHIQRAHPVRNQDMITQIRQAIRARIASGNCERAVIAADLDISIRTLSRRLKALGLDFCSVRDEVRQQLALRYLSMAELPYHDVVRKLGLSEPATLCRLSRRWFGTTPLAIRRNIVAASKVHNHVRMRSSRPLKKSTGGR